MGGGATPEGFMQPVQILTESGTWTCPKTGTYRVTCIGSGGGYIVIVNSSFILSQTYAPGGGGGIAESTLRLNKSDRISISVDSGVTSFGNYLSATAGSNGQVVTDNLGRNYAQNGIGGIGVGGNLGNYNGTDGSSTTGNDAIKHGGDTSTESKFGGALGAQVALDDNQYLSRMSLRGNPAPKGIMLYGGGRADMYRGQTNERYEPVNPKSLFGYNQDYNGAIYIEYIK